MRAERDMTEERPANVRSRTTNQPRRFNGISGRTAEGRRLRDILDAIVRALGGYDALSDVQLSDARRAAELTALAETARMQALRPGGGAFDVAALVKLEGVADRALRRLRIKPKGSRPDLRAYLAGRSAA